MYIYIYIYNIYIIYIYIKEQVRKVDDNDNFVFKHDWFLVPFQVFKCLNLASLPLCFKYLTLPRLPS